MTWFDDLVEDAMPYLAEEHLSGTAGASWQWTYAFDDDDADLASPAYVATCVIKKAVTDSASVVTVSCTFPTVKQLRCTVTPSDTAALTAGDYLLEVEIKRPSDNRCLKVVGGGDSFLTIKPEVGA